MDVEVNYKNKKRYNMAKYPLRQRKFWTWLIWVLSKITLIGKDYKVERIGMEDVKPPYMLLSNHMHFVDFELAAVATWPHPINNVVTFEAFVVRFWLMEQIGAIATRRFTMDLHLVKSIRKVLQRGDVLCMYPEARYTPCGTTGFMPAAVGKLVKKNKVPVVAIVHRGNHLHSPFWNFRKKRRVPLYTTMKLILTPEQIAEMTPEQIYEVIRRELSYDDYRYQKENGIRITESYRAEGLHKVLYQCPHCLEEFRMDSKGAELFCTACGKRWTWQEDGYLRANEGETEFDHIPDWYHWQRRQVARQIEEGTYYFEDEVEVQSLPNAIWYKRLGKAKLTHDRDNGFILQGHYRGRDYRIQRKPLQIISLHVEYDFGPLGKIDCLDISTENDSFYCRPSQANVLTKLAIATEEIHQRASRRVEGKK